MFFKDRLLGLQKMAVLLHEVAAGKLPLIVTSCVIISCVKPHYFRPRSVPRSCVPAFTVALFPLEPVNRSALTEVNIAKRNSRNANESVDFVRLQYITTYITARGL